MERLFRWRQVAPFDDVRGQLFRAEIVCLAAPGERAVDPPFSAQSGGLWGRGRPCYQAWRASERASERRARRRPGASSKKGSAASQPRRARERSARATLSPSARRPWPWPLCQKRGLALQYSRGREGPGRRTRARARTHRTRPSTPAPGNRPRSLCVQNAGSPLPFPPFLASYADEKKWN